MCFLLLLLFCYVLFLMSLSLIQNRPLRAAAVFIQATGPDAWIPTLSSRVYNTLNENGRNQSNNVCRAGIHPNLLHTRLIDKERIAEDQLIQEDTSEMAEHLWGSFCISNTNRTITIPTVYCLSLLTYYSYTRF